MAELFERPAEDVQSRRKAIEAEMFRLAGEIEEVDRKVRYYLADRAKNPHPRHLDLIEKIQGYRIDPTVSNRHLETLLENLQWKIFYYQQSWRQMWENADNSRSREHHEGHIAPKDIPEPPLDPKSNDEIPRRSQYSIDHLWAIQQEKLRSYGGGGDETRTAFTRRIAQEYKELSTKKKKGQEIVMAFDPIEKKCRLDLKGK